MCFEVNTALTKSPLSFLNIKFLTSQVISQIYPFNILQGFLLHYCRSLRAVWCSPLLILSHPEAALWPVHIFYVFSQHALNKHDGLGLKQHRAASPAGVGWSFKCSVTLSLPHTHIIISNLRSQCSTVNRVALNSESREGFMELLNTVRKKKRFALL